MAQRSRVALRLLGPATMNTSNSAFSRWRVAGLIVFVAASCGDAGDDSSAPDNPSCVEPVCTAFSALEGLDPGGLARRIGDEFRATGYRVVADVNGASWLLWRSHTGPDDHAGTAHVDRFDADGVMVASSTIAADQPIDILLHASGHLTGWRNGCGPQRDGVCFATEAADGAHIETPWPAEARTVTSYTLNDDGEVTGTVNDDRRVRVLNGAAPAADGLYAVINVGANFIARLDDDLSADWSRPLFPRVTIPGIGPGSPLEDILRAIDLGKQAVTDPVAIDGGVVVAAAVAKGTIAAINLHYGLDLALPEVPTCADVLVVRISDSGERTYWVVPTAACERLPKLTVVDDHAVVASVVSVEKTPSPNDTAQYDVALSIVDMTGSTTLSTAFGGEEDEWVEAVAPCGQGLVCVAGVLGSRSVDTGSVVSFGDGFILPVELDGTIGTVWTITSARHSTVWDLAATADGRVLFFSTTNGPITHTGDHDPTLMFNEGRLGVVTP